MKYVKQAPNKMFSRVCEEGAAAWLRRDYQTTIDLLERTSKRYPADERILLDLARAYGFRYDFSAASNCIEKAVRLSRSPAETLAEGGQRCLDFSNYGMATAFFERAILEKRVSADTVIKLAERYERMNRLDDMRELIGRAFKLDRKNPQVLLASARLQHIQGELEEAARSARSVLSTASCQDLTRVRAHYELARILDRLGKYDEVMATLLEGKAIQRQLRARFPGMLPKQHDYIRNLTGSLSKELFARWRQTAPFPDSPRRLSFLCGHPRSGTTMLEQILDAHPQLVSAEETNVFIHETYLPLTAGFGEHASQVDVLEASPRSLLETRRREYFKCMETVLPRFTSEKWLLDKNPSLTPLIPAMIRIFPESKILVALRDPRDVCLSCFMQFLPVNPISSAYLSLGGTVAEYSSQMSFWLSLRPLVDGQCLEIRYEELVSNTELVVRQVLHFLNLGWHGDMMRFYEHAKTKQINSPSYVDVAKPVYKSSVGRWQNYAQYFEPYAEKLEPLIRSFAYDTCK